MKKIFTFLLIVSFTTFGNAQNVAIPDTVFLHEVIAQGFDTNNDSIIQESEALAVKRLNLYQKGVKDFTGLSSFIHLEWLNCSYNFRFMEKGVPIDFSMMKNLKYLDASVNKFSSINVTNLTKLDTLDIEQLNLDTLDMTGLGNLKYLNLRFNNFKEIDLSNLVSLEYLAIHYNKLDGLDASPCTKMRKLIVSRNPLKSLNVQGLVELESLYVQKVDITALDLSSQNKLAFLSMSYTKLPSDYSFTDVPNLKYLSISHNNTQKLDVSHMTHLEELSCGYNAIDSLNVSGLKNLSKLSCHHNEMDTLIVEGCNRLLNLRAWENNLSALDVSSLIALKFLYISENNFTDINLHELDSLELFHARENQLSTIDLSSNKKLKRLTLENNKLTEIDVSFLEQLEILEVNKNPDLTCLSHLPDSIYDLDISETSIECISNYPQKMVAFFEQFGFWFNLLDQYTLCTPGNNPDACPTFPVVYGNVFYDLNKNGVKETDEASFEGLAIQLNPGNQKFKTNKDGDYFAILKDTGNYTATLETVNYFDSNPSSFSISATEFTDEIKQNIALQSNQDVNDLQVRIPFFTRARPGFNMIYVVEVMNYGTEKVKDITLSLEAPTFELVDSLNQFEKNGNEILYSIDTLNVGEIHKVYFYGKTNLDSFGDEVETIAAISADDFEDDIEDNNAAHVFFEVTGSFDPNDKQARDSITVQEVEAQTPIDYLIRFQNTGTDTAFNVFIVDTISANLQIESFEILSLSHDYSINWYDSNVLVFTFENILLPDSIVDEPNSHGYIYYQMTPKTDLAEGDSILNTADIYFDFNKPITTNTVKTVVYIPPVIEDEVTSIEKNNFPTIRCFPNPVKGTNQLHLSSREEMNLEIINSSGQKMQAFQKVEGTINIESYLPGLYYVKGITRSGQKVESKFIIQ